MLSDRTVESHVGRILNKLSIGDTPDDHRRVLAALAYLRGSARPGTGAADNDRER